MKTKEELNALKEDVETLSKKLNGLTEEELKEVTGGYNINDVMYTAMRCENPECGYATRKSGFWVAVVEKCPKCGQKTLHGKQLVFPW